LNMDPLCPENDLIKLAKIVYPLRWSFRFFF
jgi:hypothetical protein